MAAATALIFVRLLPIFVVSPVASFRRAPIMLRVFLCLMLSLIMVASMSSDSQTYQVELSLPSVVQEFFVGMILAFGLHAAVAVMQTFGQLIDFQVGFSAGAVFDPSSEQMASLTGELMTLSMLVVFLQLDIHHVLLTGLFELNSIMPPGSELIWSEGWIYVMGELFLLGFIITSPVVVALWLFDVGLGFVSRSLPQAQIYFVALPMKVGIGILALAWFSLHMVEPFHRLFNQSLESWEAMLQVLALEEQFDKSEDATPFKLREARKKGQIARSMEFPAFFSLVVMIGFVLVGTEGFGTAFTLKLRAWLQGASYLAENPMELNYYMMAYVQEITRFFLQVTLAGMLTYVAVSLVYAGPVFSAHPIKPDMNRVNPAQGFKRLFSRKTLFEMFKLLVKLMLFSAVFWMFFVGPFQPILNTNKAGLVNVLSDWGSVAAKFVLYLLLVFLISALFDLWYSKKDFARQMRMSKRDVKDEHKRREGSPEVKQKQKRNQSELLSKLTSMQNLKEADVIVTNPSHLAVALKYRPKEMALPIVLTKGRGLQAATIKSKGRGYGIPIVRNVSVARQLYRTTKVGQPIDTESQEKVARIYQWVVALPGNKVFTA